MKRLLITASFLFLAGFFVTPASAQTVSLSGFAWSDLPSSNTEVGAGWISFSGPNYNVVADQYTGNLSGYAWSSNYGWLSFNLNAEGTLNCPSSPCQANVNPSTGAVTGWARFIAPPTGTTGAWNGWVHLSGSNYGVTYSSATQTFSGYAWGQNDIGWIKWSGTAQNGSPYAVTMNPLIPPTATISVTVTPSSASWQIIDNMSFAVVASGTGSGNATVTPSQGGTPYSLVPGSAPTGYNFPPTITSTPVDTGSTINLSPGESRGFIVTYSETFDYSLSNSGDVAIQKSGLLSGEFGAVTITATRTAGTGQPVFLSASGLPSDTSIGFSGNGCTPNAGSPCNYVATVTVLPSAPAGSYPITITGSPLSRTTTFNLVITESPDMTLSCVASGTAQVGQDITWTVNVVNDPNDNAPYTYAWSGVSVPAEQTVESTATASFVMTYSTTGSKQIQVTVWDNVRNQAECTGYINIGVRPDFGEF